MVVVFYRMFMAMDLPAEPQETPEPPAPPGTERCPTCRRSVLTTDAACGHCGIDLERRRAIRKHKRERNARARGERRAVARVASHKKIASASALLAFLGVMTLIFGTMLGMSSRFDAQKAHAELDRFAPDQLLDFGDVRMTAAERAWQIDLQVVLAFGVNYLLAAIMLALYFWARKSPLPAFLVAFGICVLMMAVNAVLVPESLHHGMAMKGGLIVALGSGIFAAWRERERTADEQFARAAAARAARSRHPR